MNARYPVNTTGPWAQVKHHQILAALGGAILISAVVGAAVAWNESDSSAGSRPAAAGSLSSFDQIEYMTGSAAASFAPDLDTGAAEIGALKAGADVAAVSPGGEGVFDVYAGLDTGLAEIQDLKATRAGADVAVVSPAGGAVVPEGAAEAIAAHSAAFPALDGDSSGPAYSAGREGARGHVTVD